MLAKLPADRLALLRAADILEERGHCKFCRQDETGRLCVLGAISLAMTGHPGTVNFEQPVPQLFAKFIGTSPAIWNNEPRRTKEEVVMALRDAALHGI